MAYKKNFAPRSRAEVAGANDHLWISEVQIPFTKRGRLEYDRIFGGKPLNVWPRDENGDLIDD